MVFATTISSENSSSTIFLPRFPILCRKLESLINISNASTNDLASCGGTKRLFGSKEHFPYSQRDQMWGLQYETLHTFNM